LRNPWSTKVGASEVSATNTDHGQDLQFAEPRLASASDRGFVLVASENARPAWQEKEAEDELYPRVQRICDARQCSGPCHCSHHGCCVWTRRNNARGRHHHAAD